MRIGNRNYTAVRLAKGIVKHALLIFFSLIMLMPFFWMLSTSLKEPAQVYAYPPVYIPDPVVWGNYPEAFATAPFGYYIFNTIKVAVLTVFGSLIFCSMAAFAFARLNFKGREVIFSILLLTMMIPYTVRVIPLYSMMRGIGWIDTHWALIVPPMLSNVYGVFMLRQFMKGLPQELDEAARIDGANSSCIYFRIVLPLSTSGLATLALFDFKTAWNQYLPALIFINSQLKNMLTVGLTVFKGEFETAWNLMMAGAVIAVIPVIVLYLLMQRFFVKGVAMTGVKG